MTDLFALVDLLAERHALTHEEYRALVKGQTPELAAYAAKKADSLRREIYGTDIYVRGLIEIGNPTPIVTDISLPGSRFWNAVRKAGI